MNSDVEYGSSGSSGNGKLRQWLIDQVDSGKYPGLVWENDEKSIFRIPWKHAGKQDYNRDEDAALFKAWALFKGKFREGIDKPDPPTWKTRLRCALNKSNDFEELVERSQLDISDPYKVYRIIPEGAKKRPRPEDSPLSPMLYPVQSPYAGLQTQPYMPSSDCGWRDYCQEQELSYAQCPCPPHSLPWTAAPPMDNGYQIRASIYSYGPTDGQQLPFGLDPMRPAEPLTDPRLHVCVFYRDILVREVTTASVKGCHITPCGPEEKHFLPPGGPELVPLPDRCMSPQSTPEESPPSPSSSMDQGVLLWMGSDGLYAQRLCQSRVYWQGGQSSYGDKPNKLERDVPCRLLHTQEFLTELQSLGLHGRPLPRFQVLLSFGDECLDPRRQRGSLTVQVEPLFARQLLYYTQQTSSHYFRGYEHTGLAELIHHPEDFQRPLAHHHSSSSLQD
ncbi:interferon regulatory factor 4-like isoform X2 [Eucyclogobius newberryi]|uniref:interferon regulatory factor 4-like isoform X2 n=1 Tax=Eucyclogobius newberryi TaxID=166745 RepID=UPI003B5A71F9